ncbi:energy transducer TonB [Halioglobus maricola]|nr:energy transducer TonB [Halioglobus maricola]
MRNALLAALGLHLALIAAVTFEYNFSAASKKPQIEVTLATRPADNAPSEARHIAQANQEGSGQEAELDLVTSSNNQLPMQSPTPQQAAPRRMEKDAQATGDLLTTTAATQEQVALEQAEREQRHNPTDGISPEMDRINQQLASLQAQLDEQTRAQVKKPRVRRLTAVSARQAADAAYLADWRQRLEAVGNKYYPEASIRYGLYGDLRLLVAIRKDGTLGAIQILESSGYAVLDEAAIKIVRMAAPYSPFPPELAATTDTLEIIRTWQFQENELSSNQQRRR